MLEKIVDKQEAEDDAEKKIFEAYDPYNGFRGDVQYDSFSDITTVIVLVLVLVVVWGIS